MEQNNLKKEAAFRISPNEKTLPISSLDIPWQGVDIKSSNCPRHAGVRLHRIDDDTYVCPLGHEKYSNKGSVTNQTNRDRYDLGMVLKGPSVYPKPGKV